MQAQNTEIVVFSSNAVSINFADKKGNQHTLSAEGALFKGGAALAALKDKVLMEAGNKAANGKYRAAADILATAFPALSKSFDKIIGTPWANKSAMSSYLSALERADAPRNGFTAKQVQAQAFIKALRTIDSLKVEGTTPMTIDAEPQGLRRAA